MDPQPTPAARWKALSPERQFSVAHRVIARRAKEWARRHPSLMSVGFGIRHKSNARLKDESPGLLFAVAKKKDQPKGGISSQRTQPA